MFNERLSLIAGILTDETGSEDAFLTEGGEHADLASTIAFSLAKQRKAAPHKIAPEIASQIRERVKSEAGADVTVSGPYLNFSFTDDYADRAVLAALKPEFGYLGGSRQRTVLEHTSANPNGPLHVGHIRNTVIGDTLSRCFRKAGRKTEVQYYVNDMGRQIAIVVWGFDRFRKPLESLEKGDHHVASVYIDANRDLKEDPSLTAEVDRLMQMVESGDPDTVRRFRSAVTRCLEGFRVTLGDLNAKHDRFVWESDFIRNGDTGRVIARFDRLPECRHEETLNLDLTSCGFEKNYVLRRSDGTTVYAARDIAYHIWKGRNFDRMIDVLGADHKLIGAQLSAALRLLGEKAPEIVFFEFVSLPEGSMSTRAGKFISADELIAEVRKKAFQEVTTRRPELPVEEREKIAASVAIAAIRYDIVKVSAEKATVFDWNEALDFERQSGPYIQYAHARACSILEKAGDFNTVSRVSMPTEIALAKQIGKFPYVLERVITDLKPAYLALYARDLADLFNAFYHAEPVLKAEGGERDARLTLVLASQLTLKNVLETLGIDAVRSM